MFLLIGSRLTRVLADEARMLRANRADMSTENRKYGEQRNAYSRGTLEADQTG